jgi:hypothetical protein
MPAPTAFTMEDVLLGVLIELRYAPGRDVQIHLQSSIIQDANILYRTLMQRYVWRDFLYMTPFTTDPVTGLPVEDLSAVMMRYSDVLAVFQGTNDRPLPYGAALTNPKAVRHPTIFPASPPDVFVIYPFGTYECTLYSRLFNDADYGIDDQVPFYKDLLVLGTAYQLSLKSGTNVELTSSLKSQFETLVQTYRMDEIKPQYNARPVNVPNPMTDWWVQT